MKFLKVKGVEYLNKLGKFVGPNTIELTDKKGNVTTKTAARFVVAVGGRPTPLDCPGAEHAITSDDLFKLEKAPGKTCVVGAGYVGMSLSVLLAQKLCFSSLELVFSCKISTLVTEFSPLIDKDTLNFHQ